MDNGIQHSDSSRTWLCTVVFLDIVGYSKRTVDHQLQIKEHFNDQVSSSIENVAEKERIILDTGDGAALCFLGDPENALLCAISLRNAIDEAGKTFSLPYEVCIGINLGPVKLIKDVNGRENAVGDGINTAQRIMGFSQPGQILVSRSYYEVISCLGEDFARLFHYQGVHADKHVRKHTVYEVRPGGVGEEAGVVNEAKSGVHEFAVQDAPVGTEATIPGGELEKIERDLARCIGPLAATLVRRLAPECTDGEALRQRLAEHIPDKNERSEFLARDPNAGHNGGESGPAPDAQDAIAVADTEVFEPDPQWFGELEQYLLQDLGPVARVLLRKACREVTNNDELVSRIADEIDDPGRRQALVDRFGR